MLANLFEGKDPRKKYLLFCAPDPPPAPNYTEAAKAQGQAGVDAAISQGKINNPNVINPYGTQTTTWSTPTLDQAAWTKANQAWQAKNQAHIKKYGIPIPESAWSRPDIGGPPVQRDFMVGGGVPTITQQFSPEQQAIFSEGNKAKLGLSQLASQGTELAKGVLGNSLDLSQAPPAPGSAEETRTKAVDAIMSRVNEDIDRQKNTLNSNLIAAGIPPGSKAYDDAMALTERARTDARNQAIIGAGQEMSRDFQTDTQRRKDSIAEMLLNRQTPINEITALMSGSQVNNPFAVPGYAQNAQVSAAPLFAAQQLTGDWNADLYNAKAAQAGNLQQGLFGLGSAGLMAYGMG